MIFSEESNLSYRVLQVLVICGISLLLRNEKNVKAHATVNLHLFFYLA